MQILATSLCTDPGRGVSISLFSERAAILANLLNNPQASGNVYSPGIQTRNLFARGTASMSTGTVKELRAR